MPRKKKPIINRLAIVPKPTPRPVARLVKLWRFLTPTMRERLTALMRSTPGTMRQYVEGRRSISPDIAIRFEKATYKLGVDPVNRMQLSPTCKKCEYALRCNPKGKAK